VNAAAPILTQRESVMCRPLRFNGGWSLRFGICTSRHRVCMPLIWRGSHLGWAQ
jgi:hypothetical protein